jgi:hypothetical protein
LINAGLIPKENGSHKKPANEYYYNSNTFYLESVSVSSPLEIIFDYQIVKDIFKIYEFKKGFLF